MGLYKVNNVWWVSYTLPNNKRIRESTGIKVDEKTTLNCKTITTNKQAELYWNDIDKKLKTGHFETLVPEARKAQEFTIEDMKTLWFSRQKTKEKASLHHDEIKFAVIIDIIWKDTPISSLDESHILKLEIELSNRKTRTQSNFSQATINRYKALLRSALRYAKKKGKTVKDSVLISIEIAKENNARDRICTEKELQLLVKTINSANENNKELILAIAIGYSTPLRLGAIVSMKWNQINMKTGFAYPKQGASNKTRPVGVPLGKDALTILSSMPIPMDQNQQIFKSTSGRISQGFCYYTKKAKIKDLRFHDLKHTSLTNLSNAGVPIHELQAMSGHKTLAMLSRYIHPDENKLRENLEKVEALRQTHLTMTKL